MGQFTLITYAFEVFINSVHIELLYLFAHVPCSFPGESECEDMGGVDAFRFDHTHYIRGDGRGLTSACACEDRVRGLGLFD